MNFQLNAIIEEYFNKETIYIFRIQKMTLTVHIIFY